MPTPPILHARPYELKAPKSYDGTKAVPLVLALHAYGSTGPSFVDLWHLDELSQDKGFLLAYPTGTIERSAERNRFWNATDACCDFYGAGVDDVAYLGAILDDVEARYDVDAKRVYVVGFSNGAFMAHRLACELAPRIAAIVSMGGDTWRDPARCPQSSPVAVLEVHATNDQVIPGAGGPLPFADAGALPSTDQTVLLAAEKNGCGHTESSGGPPVDVDARVPGAETTRRKVDGCPAGAGVEAWQVVGGQHVPRISERWPDAMWSFLSRQHRP